MDRFSIPEIIAFISIILSVVYRIITFNKIKKNTVTKEGREHVATKGGKAILALEGHIVISVIIFLFIFIMKLNIVITILLEIALWSVSISFQRKLQYKEKKV